MAAPPPLFQPAAPNYAALLAADPSVLAAQQAYSAGQISNAAQRAAATDRALIQYGSVPSFNGLGLSGDQLGFLNQDVTPDIAALAQQNTAAGLSTQARLQQAHDQAVLALQQHLAARGALSSGEDPYQMGLQQQSYTQAQSDAVNQLLDAISGFQNSYTQSQQQAQQQLIQAMQAAAAQEAQLAQNQPVTYSYDPGSGTYVGGDGSTMTPAGGNTVKHSNGSTYGVDSNGNTYPIHTASNAQVAAGQAAVNEKPTVVRGRGRAI